MYVWLLNHAQTYLGINPEHIILSGDSAGGFMCVAVTILAILRGVKLPEGILMHYPAISTDINEFFPSLLLGLDDTLLS